MNAPESFDQALDLAVDAANQYVHLVIELAAARAHHQLRAAGLDYVRATGQGDLDIATYREEHAQYDVHQAEEILKEFTGESLVWSSGYQYDDYGNEYWFKVTYQPRDFCYVVTRHTEGGGSFSGEYPTLDEAIAHAEKLLYPEELESRPEPDFSREDSTAAGELVINFHGKAVAIKVLVDQVLDEANHGCGQHYEIFARRARNALDQLPHHVSNEADREALEKYLAFERF